MQCIYKLFIHLWNCWVRHTFSTYLSVRNPYYIYELCKTEHVFHACTFASVGVSISSMQKERLLTLITWQKRESWAVFCIASCVSFGHTFRNMPLPKRCYSCRRNRCVWQKRHFYYFYMRVSARAGGDHRRRNPLAALFLPSCRSGGDNWFNHHYAWKYLRPIGRRERVVAAISSDIFVAHSALESRKMVRVIIGAWDLRWCTYTSGEKKSNAYATAATKFFYCSLRKYESDCERGACVPKSSSSPVLSRI